MRTRRLPSVFRWPGIPVLAVGLLPAPAVGQTAGPPYTFTTLAGTAGTGCADGPAGGARFWGPEGVALDPFGNLFVADTGNQTIRRIAPDGIVTTLAGKAGFRGSVDGSGAEARFDDPVGVAADAAGNVYVVDSGDSTIRKITPSGVVTTLAGLAGSTGSDDGVGRAARFKQPTGVAVDAAGTV